MNKTGISFLTEKVIELSGVLSGIQVSIQHLEKGNVKILEQTTLTNGRVTALEKLDIKETIEEVKELQKQLLEVKKVNDDQELSIKANEQLKNKWWEFVKNILMVIGIVVTVVSTVLGLYYVAKGQLPPDALIK